MLLLIQTKAKTVTFNAPLGLSPQALRSLDFLSLADRTKTRKTSSEMLNNSLANPSTAPFPISSAHPASPNRLNFVQVPRSNSLESSFSYKVESSKNSSNTSPSSSSSSPAKLLESSHAVSTPPYPGGMGPHTGRDPNVKKPDWLRQRAPQGEKFARLKGSIGELKLNTVCVEAQCPNIGEVLLFQIIFIWKRKLFQT